VYRRPRFRHGRLDPPAGALCGVVGLKPTYGRVYRYGLIAFASSLDQIGPFTKDVEDCAIVMNVIAGNDPRESTSVPEEVPITAGFSARGRGWTVGIPKEYFVAGIDPEGRGGCPPGHNGLGAGGAQCRRDRSPTPQYCLASTTSSPGGASSNLPLRGVRFGFRSEGNRDLLDMYKKTRSAGFGAEVETRNHARTYALSSGYYDAYYRRPRRSGP